MVKKAMGEAKDLIAQLKRATMALSPESDAYVALGTAYLDLVSGALLCEVLPLWCRLRLSTAGETKESRAGVPRWVAGGWEGCFGACWIGHCPTTTE